MLIILLLQIALPVEPAIEVEVLDPLKEAIADQLREGGV